jgi:hypothetical protein
MVWRKEGFYATILLVSLALLLGGCAGVQTTGQDQVINEYLLTQAGFKKMEVNDTTPKRQALLNATPRGEFLAYRVEGAKWYVYGDQNLHILYVGDEAAYQRYASKVNDKRLCQSLDASDSAPFWSCYQEMQKGGKK